MDEDLLPELGDLLFSMLISYAGALEFLYVVRHLYHWSCGHANAEDNDPEGLKRYQDRMRNELAAAEALEESTGLKAMQDGVLYKDGYRVDPQQQDIDKLKAQQKAQELKEERRKEMEAELKKQKEIEQQTRKELERAEAELARQQREAEEAEKRQRAEEEAKTRKQEMEQRKLEEQKEVAENARKLLEAERAQEEAQRQADVQKEEEEENARKLLEAERTREEEERRREAAELQRAAEKAQEAAENERILLEAERAREAAERQLEEEARKREADRELEKQNLAEATQKEKLENIEQETTENDNKLIEAEREREAAERQHEIEEAEVTTKRNEVDIAATVGAVEREGIDEQAVIDSLQRYLDMETERELREKERAAAAEQEMLKSMLDAERDYEQKQKLIEENARKFLEADKEMGELQERLESQLKRQLSATESTPQTPVYEPPCIKKIVTGGWSSPDEEPVERITQTVKTQLGQVGNEPYSVTTKPLLFTSISDDISSIEPQSSLSAHQSDEFATGTDETPNTIDVQISQLERQDPDGEDNESTPSTQYTDDYLRSLDGIKNRPLMREDGSGRRRAFKKRRSSGSSNSSRDSRTSREEEVKMFTSLEEEEMQPSKEGNTDFTPIKYTGEPTLKVKGHRRRHKRSPAKDMRPTEANVRSSLEMLDEENTNPWGELPPEHYKDMEFWKREKALSIDEEEIDLERPASRHEVEEDVGAKNVPKTSSFEEASHVENEAAISALQQQHQQPKEDRVESEAQAAQDVAARSETKPNLQTSQRTEDRASAGRSSASPRLRRSPRIDEIDQYEERWNAETEAAAVAATSTVSLPQTPQTPTISVQKPTDNAPWRDEYGLIMEGLSDFYDFTASVNPSRSRPTSRQPSPASSQPSSPLPENVAYSVSGGNGENQTIDVYDDTGDLQAGELKCKNIIGFIETMEHSNTESMEIIETEEYCEGSSPYVAGKLQNVVNTDDENPEKLEDIPARAYSPLKLNVQVANNLQTAENNDTLEENTHEMVETLRADRSEYHSRSRSRSRSRSPLPTPDNIERSLEKRREKLIKHNDELFEKLRVQSPVEIEIQTAGDVQTPEKSHTSEEEYSKESMNLLVATLRQERSRSRSRSPLPTADNIERGLKKRRQKLIQQNDEMFEKLHVESPIEIEIQAAEDIQTPEEECTREDMHLLVEKLRQERSHSHTRTRSRSPLPTRENLEHSLEIRRQKLIQHNDALFEQLQSPTESRTNSELNAPTISVECVEDTQAAVNEDAECSRENMSTLVEMLRQRRSRSTSKSPMRFVERARTPEPTSPITASNAEEEDIYELRERRSRSPSRSQSGSPSRFEAAGLEPAEQIDYSDFHMMLNLEASDNKTLSKRSEEMESMLAEKQRLLDEEALHKLNTASEEVELRTLTPTDIDNEANDTLSEMPLNERMRQLRCSPTTPDYERSISAEWRDVQRIKSEMISSGFKRSTYAGESMDLGSEFEPLREAAAHFRRSQSPSPSFVEGGIETAAVKREVQEQILAELISASESVANENKLGAKPKAERESIDLTAQYEEMRRLNAEFKRSRSQSRSPLGEAETEMMANIEAEAVKREFQIKMLDEIEKNNVNFQEFSRHLNPEFLDSDRRASDSVLIQKPELLIQLQDMDADLDLEPEDYHHFRRFSLNQEQAVEEYPNDDYIYVSQIEVQTPSGTRTWIREDYYSEDFEALNLLSAETAIVERVSVEEANVEHIEHVERVEPAQQEREEEESDGSEDERQTVVDVEDEIDEDICDFNERGPADESHHEQSECEEAEREMDRYADRGVDDWRQVDDINELVAAADEGAVGGVSPSTAYDSDSFAIDQIYDEAIKNRKQSGILRDYDSILKEMQNNYMETEDGEVTSESDRYAIWAKTRALQKQDANRQHETTVKFIENERKDLEVRYLGDANVHARQSTRLRSRYGYVPLLHSNAVDDVEVDLNYKPKKEYNWRKNFKLDEDGKETMEGETNDDETLTSGRHVLDMRKYSLGGESITLFSQSPEKANNAEDECVLTTQIEEIAEVVAEATNNTVEEIVEKPKKKKSKKKLRKETKNSIENYSKDEDDSESQSYSRRSSSIQMETDSPKRKSRSRRSSKSSLNNDDAALFSPRSSVANMESFDDIMEELDATPTATTTATKKKTKKRKKAKDTFSAEPDISEEYVNECSAKSIELDLTQKVDTVSAIITPETASINLLAALSPQPSVCATPSSLEAEILESTESQTKVETVATIAAPAPAVTVATRTATTSTTTTRTTVDTFDILKDANFYPLF